jgi:hypothetical protein
VSLDRDMLSGLVKRLVDSEYVRAETTQEKACFAVLDDLDHVGGHVKGTLTNKKYMCNEIWSLISFLGAPSWFITLSPADNRHPICLYFADTGDRFSPELRSSTDRNHLIAANPLAAARFFDLIVRSFIKNVLGMNQDHPGLYGKTSGYYGTIEQQGRLTLHLHLLLWIEGALSPQEIRDRLMLKDSAFQGELIEYLELFTRVNFSPVQWILFVQLSQCRWSLEVESMQWCASSSLMLFHWPIASTKIQRRLCRSLHLTTV